MNHCIEAVREMSHYARTTERKKRGIIRAARELFNEKGFAGATIKEIAAVARVSPVSIYNYFGSKERLVAECVQEVVADTLKEAVELLHAEMDFRKKMEQALMLCTEKVDVSVSELFTRKALRDPELADLLDRELRERKNDVYRSYIRLGQQEGLINDTIPMETMLAFMEAMAIMGSKVRRGNDAPEKVRQLHHLLLFGMIGE